MTDSRTLPQQLRDAAAQMASEYPYDSGIAGGSIGLLYDAADEIERLTPVVSEENPLLAIDPADLNSSEQK